jgi:hypothetical protein
LLLTSDSEFELWEIFVWQWLLNLIDLRGVTLVKKQLLTFLHADSSPAFLGVTEHEMRMSLEQHLPSNDVCYILRSGSSLPGTTKYVSF